MDIFGYRFTPRLFTTTVTILAVALFSSLCIWQLQRAEYRQSVYEQHQKQSQQPPIDISKVKDGDAVSRYRTVEAVGVFNAEHEILLDNSTHHGVAGYHVITPLKITATGKYILVNRGWLPVGRDRRELPQTSVPDGVQKISGYLDKPRTKPAFIHENNTPNMENNNRWQYLESDYYAKYTGLSVLPYLLFQTSASQDELQRNWPVMENKWGMHIGYAIQWGAFALIAIIAWFILNTYKIQKSEDNQ